jgi:hypothetical protein
VLVTCHTTGVTLDFPLSPSGHEEARRKAWRFFEIGILLSLGSVIWFAVCQVAGWTGIIPRGIAIPLCIGGIIALVASANRSRWAWSDARGDGFLCQLAVAGDMLIRTWRDGRKQIWYRHEIRAIEVESKNVVAQESEGCNTYLSAFACWIVVELHDGKKLVLLADGSSLPADIFRPRAELERLATLLSQALQSPLADVSPDAIRAADGYSNETHITQ